jgi:hypothetical protein
MPFEADSASDRRLLILRFRRVCLGTFLFLNAFTAPALGQGPVHRKEAIILEGRAKDKNYPDDPSYDQVDMEANAAQMKAALEAHGYTVQVTNSWTGDKDSFTGIISALSTGANALVASDEVVIYITGHGKQSEGGAGNFVDKADLTDRKGDAVDPNAAVNHTYYGVMEIGGTGSNRAGNPTVTSTMLKREIQKLPDKHTGVVIDTCYAGMNIVPLKQIPGVQSIYTASAAWECAYFGAVGTTIPITWSDGKTQFPLVDRNGAEGSAFSYPFIQGLSSAPANASIGDLLQAGGNFALTHDPTAIAGTKDTVTQHPLPAYATDTQKKQYKYKTHPQSYSRPDPRIALTNAQNAYNTAQTNFQAAQDKALGTAKAVNDAAIARDAAKAANPQGGQAVNDAQTALEKAIANDAAAAGAERAAKETLDAKKGDVDKAQAILNEVSYNSPSAETDKGLAMAAPRPSTQVSFDGSGPENSALATSATSAPPDLPDYEQPPVPARIDQPAIVVLPVQFDQMPRQFAQQRHAHRLVVDPGLAPAIGAQPPLDDQRLARLDIDFRLG